MNRVGSAVVLAAILVTACGPAGGVAALRGHHIAYADRTGDTARGGDSAFRRPGPS